MPIRLNARQISVFTAVMRLGGASAASEFLHISQPAISKTLALMEEELGYALFRRTGRGLSPTPEARALMPHAERVMAELDRLQANAAVIGRGLTGTLTIGGNYTLVSLIATEAVARLRARHPEIGVRISSTAADLLVESVFRREIDVALIYGPAPPYQVHVEPLCSFSCACAFPENHRFARLDSVSVDDLLVEPVMTYSESSPTGAAMRNLFARAERRLEPAITFGNTMTLLDMVRRGLGVGLVDTFEQFAPLYPDLRSAPLSPTLQMNAMIVTAHETPSNPAFPILLEEIRAAARRSLRNDRPPGAP